MAVSAGTPGGPLAARGYPRLDPVPEMVKMSYRVEIEQEEDGRFLAEVIDLPGVMAYGDSREIALAHAQALALRVLADRLEHGEGLAPEDLQGAVRMRPRPRRA